MLPLSDSEDEGGDLEEKSEYRERVNVAVETYLEDLLNTSGEAFVVAESVQSGGMAELYDFRCTNNISPYRRFKNFKSITPCHFCAANKQTFSTTGTGDVIVDVPNGSGSMQLRLHDVLYSAEVGYTLVSVGRLDEAGFSVNFGGDVQNCWRGRY